MPNKRPTSHPSKSKKSSSSDPDTEPPTLPDPSPPGGAAGSKSPNPKNPKPSTTDAPPSSPKPVKKPSKTPKMIPKDPDATDAFSLVPSAADADATSPRKSQRKRKAREFPDDEPPAAFAGGDKGGSSHSTSRLWTDDNAVALMRGLIEFRARTGANPTPSTIASFFDSVKASLPSQITQDQVYNKLRHLRHKFVQATAHGSDDTTFYKLAVEAWGGEGKKANGTGVKKHGNSDIKVEAGGKENDEGDEGADSCLFIRHNLVEYWREHGLPDDMLEMGLKLVDPAKAKALEGKWRRHCSAELKLQMKRLDFNKEICAVLGAAAANRDTSP